LAVAVGVPTLPATSTGLLVAPVGVVLGPETEPEEQRQPDKGLPVEQVTPTKVAVVAVEPALLAKTLLDWTRVEPVVLVPQHIQAGAWLLMPES
jgi:hypothetical protein